MSETVDLQAATAPPAAADSDKALRYLKASEAVEAAFAAAGYAGAPDGIKAIVTTRTNSLTENIPVGSLSSSGGIMAAEAASGVSLALASLTETQREALKKGGDIDEASYTKLNALLLGTALGIRRPSAGLADNAGDGVSSNGNSSLRFGEMPGGDWTRLPSVRAAQSLAAQYGMAWATGNRELMMLGPSAIQALHDVDLKIQTYERLTKDASFKANEVVDLAKFAKKNHVDANKLGGVVADTVTTLAPKDVPQQRKIDEAVGGYVKNPNAEAQKRVLDVIAPLAVTPEQQRQALQMTDALKIKHEEAEAALKATQEKNAKADAAKAEAARKAAEAEAAKAEAARRGARANDESAKGTSELAALNSLWSEPPPRSQEPDKSKPSKVPNASKAPEPARPAPAKNDSAKQTGPKP